jgi:hypothetical protein
MTPEASSEANSQRPAADPNPSGHQAANKRSTRGTGQQGGRAGLLHDLLVALVVAAAFVGLVAFLFTSVPWRSGPQTARCAVGQARCAPRDTKLTRSGPAPHKSGTTAHKTEPVVLHATPSTQAHLLDQQAGSVVATVQLATKSTPSAPPSPTT